MNARFQASHVLLSVCPVDVLIVNDANKKDKTTIFFSIQTDKFTLEIGNIESQINIQI